MIDVNKQVRTAFVQALDGVITVDSAPVPVWNLQNPNEGGPKLYLVINNVTGTNNSDKGRSRVIGTMQVDVVQLTDGVYFDTVDDVVSEVKEILQPTVTGHGLTDPAGLKIVTLEWLDDQELPLLLEHDNTMRRSIRYEYKVDIL